jgi:hypothetical protein
MPKELAQQKAAAWNESHRGHHSQCLNTSASHGTDVPADDANPHKRIRHDSYLRHAHPADLL